MSRFEIGDKVRLPGGDEGIVYDVYTSTVRVHPLRKSARDWQMWKKSDCEPVNDIPRERVEALHAAVTARLEQLDASRAGTYFASEKDIFAACHSDLSEVAEALRLLLEADDAA